jgi:site-specific DNA recombinase
LLQHRQMSLVARLLNEQGMLPRGARLPTGKKPLWTKEAISRVLRSPLYAGFITLGEERCAGEHPALVEATTFDAAQAILRGSERDVSHGGFNHDYLLRGLLRCGECGAALTPGSTRRGDQLYRYYRCTARSNVGVKACHSSPVPGPAIEDYVIERIRHVATDPAFIDGTKVALEQRINVRREAAEMLCQKLPSRVATLSSLASKLAEQLTQLEGRARELVAQKLNIESEKLGEAESQLAGAKQEREHLAGIVAETAWVTNALADFSKVWEVLTVPNRGRLLRALIDRITVDEPSGRIEIRLVEFTPQALEAA